MQIFNLQRCYEKVILINYLNPHNSLYVHIYWNLCVYPACSFWTKYLCSALHSTHCSRHALFYHFTSGGVFFVPLYHFALDHSSGVQMVRPEVDFMPASVRIMDRLLTRSNQTLPSPWQRWLSGVCLRAAVCTGEQQERRETKTLRQTDTQTVLIPFKYLSYPHQAAAGPNSNTATQSIFEILPLHGSKLKATCLYLPTQLVCDTLPKTESKRRREATEHFSVERGSLCPTATFA